MIKLGENMTEIKNSSFLQLISMAIENFNMYG